VLVGASLECLKQVGGFLYGKRAKERALGGLFYMPQIVPFFNDLKKKSPKSILKSPKQLWCSSIFTTSKNVKFEMHKPKTTTTTTTTTTEPKLFAKCKIVFFGVG
jgi:hypothetical protein